MNEEILCSVQMTQLRSFIVRMTFDPIHFFFEDFMTKGIRCSEVI